MITITCEFAEVLRNNLIDLINYAQNEDSYREERVKAYEKDLEVLNNIMKSSLNDCK